MAGTFPPPPPLPTIILPPANTVVQVSAAQVWSAAAQNLLIAGIIGYLMAIGKVSTELGLPGLLAIAGIDLLGRFKAKASPLAALAVGATSMLSKVPHMLFALILGTALLGCGQLQAPKSPADMAELVRSALDSAVYVCTKAPVGVNADLDKSCDQIVRAKAGLCEPLSTSNGQERRDAGVP
jgi:hypothetical protein